ncbi:DUF2569 family protein [Luteolibacter sp. LG18]|uniref:DUF2569 family protein n=1 Tax=Luteolibacter sp. LG18 TaxID=2819286 RepID=UPI002B2E3AD4|nr:hypothetical protein llg_25230 [Luteolibacter sp. LG18]
MQIHVQLDGAPSGPHNRDEIEALLVSGRVTGETLAWTQGMATWQPLDTLLPVSPSTPEAASAAPLNPYAPPVHAGSLPQAEYRTGPTGIGGWLLFYCVSLTILTPLMVLKGLADSLATLTSDTPPALRAGILIESAGFLALVIAGIVVGVMLWTRKPRAVRIVRKFLVFRVVATLALEATTILIMCSSLAPEVATTVTIAGGTMVFRELIHFAIWFSYFKKSRRVANTFPEEAV